MPHPRMNRQKLKPKNAFHASAWRQLSFVFVEITFSDGTFYNYDNLTREQYDSFWLCDTRVESIFYIGNAEFTNEFTDGNSEGFTLLFLIYGQPERHDTD